MFSVGRVPAPGRERTRARSVPYIGAVVWVERPSQKGIVIGKGGRVLKAVGEEARANMESLFGARVHLEIWVKARAGWPNDEKVLRGLGYDG